MSQNFAANGTVNIFYLDENQRECFINDLHDVLDMEDVAVDTQNHTVHFYANGEVCTCDDIPSELHELAKKHSVNFMANIDQNDDGYGVHFFGNDAEDIKALKVEYAVNTAADAFQFIGVEPKWLRPALKRLAEEKPLRAVLCEDAGTKMWLESQVPLLLLACDLDVEGCKSEELFIGTDGMTQLYGQLLSPEDGTVDPGGVETFFKRFEAIGNPEPTI
ncbi:conserved protein of unknown function [Acidithiobacillus ferrivorans]|uniref:Uncharacterized protein n=1 Tax=Acidithiobacillus ferrivorans TaxID=160808 RepID=A0A060UKJ5_9PROT|nr:hypothetical protein [Acidithiobacillus ferrivorans]CDQ09207.1 conserved hypothetical protein [Acidithiobacillus ferrivorans]SMH64875.1 conserved protein of unknown function [Acidithiobacillus ferrivorans]